MEFIVKLFTSLTIGIVGVDDPPVATDKSKGFVFSCRMVSIISLIFTCYSLDDLQSVAIINAICISLEWYRSFFNSWNSINFLLSHQLDDKRNASFSRTLFGMVPSLQVSMNVLFVFLFIFNICCWCCQTISNHCKWRLLTTVHRIKTNILSKLYSSNSLFR